MSPFDAWARHVNPGLGRFLRAAGRDLRFVRGSGVVLEEEGGRRFEDWYAGFGALNLGHAPHAIHEAIRERLARGAPGLFVEFPNPDAGALAERLCAAAGPSFGTAFLCNSGSEAVEAAVKTAVAATGRTRIVRCEGAYHGTTLGALACTGRGPYRDGFEPLLADFPEVPFGDLAALDRALAAGDAAAFLAEPIQAEAGIRLPPAGYLRQARALCGRDGALLILDEVQTGMGRTGTLFAFEAEGAVPDILVLAKALGGGVAPIGAAVMREGLWERAFPGILRAEAHNSTLGGNAIACAAAGKALGILGDPAFLEGVRRRGADLFGRLEREIGRSPAVERISWRGLLGGVKLREPAHPALAWESLGAPELSGRPAAGALVVERLARRGILAQVCGHDWSVVRVEPPLVVDEAACGRFAAAMREAVSWVETWGG